MGDKINWEKIFTTLYNAYTTCLSEASTLQERSVKMYNRMLASLAENGIPYAESSRYCTYHEVNMVFQEVEELEAAGYSIDKASVAVFKMFEKIRIRLFGTSIREMTTLNTNDLMKFSKFLSEPNSGSIIVVASALGILLECGELVEAGREDEVRYTLFRYGNKLLYSTLLAEFAGIIVTGIVVTNPGIALGIILGASLIGTAFGEAIALFMESIAETMENAGMFSFPVDPLIFDLDGDGIETVSVRNGVNFDFDNNGFAERIAWVGPDDGLLVRDLNGNGNIDNGGELFGDLTAIAEGIYAVNGFEALAAFDSNHDGVVDALDQIFNELKIWQDENQNGTVDEGELMTLQEAGISAINLQYADIDQTDSAGNMHSQIGSYVKTDGSTGMIEDVWFMKDASDTVLSGNDGYVLLEETDDIAVLPDIEGRGNQYSLHQAMLRDESGLLQSLVEQYVEEEDAGVRKNLVTQIIYVWTGVVNSNPADRGPNISDARKLEALEVITGRPFDSQYGRNPVYQAGIYIEKAFDKLVELYYTQLECQTTYAGFYGGLYLNADIDEDGNILFDTEGLLEKFEELYLEDAAEGKKTIIAVLSNMKLSGVLEMIESDAFYTELSAYGDIRHAIDFMGDDIVGGTSGNDILIGEKGNDILYGEDGDDTYIFNIGDGQDVVYEYNNGGTDSIVFGAGISPSDIIISRDNGNLYLTNRVSGDRVTIPEAFYYGNFVETVEFADGTVWTPEYFRTILADYYGTEGNDTLNAYDNINGHSIEDNRLYGYGGDDVLYGNRGDDELYGGAGDDRLEGGLGDDLLVGGPGDDVLLGEAGDDTYLFNLGDGNDIILENWGGGTDRVLFGAGISPSDIIISRDGGNLYLTNRVSGDRVTIPEAFYYGNFVETVEFADGTVWTPEYFRTVLADYYGTEGDDTLNAYDNINGHSIEDNRLYGYGGDDVLYGNRGDDELYGGAGDDRLEGGLGDDLLVGGPGDDVLLGEAGDDTYLFNLGDGNDIILENWGGGTDRVLFGAGISPSDIIISRDGGNLYLTNRVSGDSLKIEGAFYYGNFVETVEFADGTVWTPEHFRTVLADYYGTEGNDTLNAYDSVNGLSIEDNRLYGYGGDDMLYGNKGDDELYGGAGDDRLEGGLGDDFLVGGPGNDFLSGDNGDDTYLFNLGDGDDIVYEYYGAGTDRVLFGAGISPSDIVISRDGGNLYLTNRVSGDSLKIEGAFYYGNFVETVEFADGTVWTPEHFRTVLADYHGTEGDDTLNAYDSVNGLSIEDNRLYGYGGDDMLYGNRGDDELYGGAGDDRLEGGLGDDLLVGGTGDDILSGDGGDDTYIFNLGDGDDTVCEYCGEGTDSVLFGTGISPEDLMFTRQGCSVCITNWQTGDTVTLWNQFYAPGCGIESIETADGSVLDYTKLELIIQAMADFETDTGMSWQDAIEEQNAQALYIVNQWWVRDAS